eukprot:SAG11_NODE_6240_length_1355_cov_1.588376_2_plen_171_part_00
MGLADLYEGGEAVENRLNKYEQQPVPRVQLGRSRSKRPSARCSCRRRALATPSAGVGTMVRAERAEAQRPEQECDPTLAKVRQREREPPVERKPTAGAVAPPWPCAAAVLRPSGQGRYCVQCREGVTAFMIGVHRRKPALKVAHMMFELPYQHCRHTRTCTAICPALAKE